MWAGFSLTLLVNLLADSCRGRREIFGRNFFMKRNFLKWSGVWIASILAVSAVSAQEINEVEQMRKELREMRERMQSLEQKLGSIEQKPVVVAPTSEAIPGITAAPRTPPLPMSSWKPSDPIRIGKGGAYMDIGMVATFAAGGSTR